jgi:serine protease Do
MRPFRLSLSSMLTYSLIAFVLLIAAGWTVVLRADQPASAARLEIPGLLADTISPVTVSGTPEDSLRDTVVTIHSLRPQAAHEARYNVSMPDGWRKFVGEKLSYLYRWIPTNLQSSARGCGVVVRSDGYIITNTDVLNASDQVTVRFTDGKERKATIICSDEETGLALIKVDETDLTPAKFAIPRKCDIGAQVTAMGSDPVTTNRILKGTITDTSFKISGRSDKSRFILTNAAVVLANNGGPLVDRRGQVIGINIRPYSKLVRIPAIGCAIPSDVVCEMIKTAIPSQQFENKVLGARIEDVDVKSIETHPLFGYGAVVITNVDSGGTADRSGLKRGDLILEFGGTRVDSAHQLESILNSVAPESTIDAVVDREGRRHVLSLRFQKMIAQKTPARRPGVPDIGLLAARLKDRWFGDITRQPSQHVDPVHSWNDKHVSATP